MNEKEKAQYIKDIYGFANKKYFRILLKYYV